MFLDYHRTSKGAFVIKADVVGSMGEIVHTQVGRFHKSPNVAIAAARREAARKGWKYVVVENVNTDWRYTVVV